MAEQTNLRMSMQEFMERFDEQLFEIIDGEIIEWGCADGLYDAGCGGLGLVKTYSRTHPRL